MKFYRTLTELNFAMSLDPIRRMFLYDFPLSHHPELCQHQIDGRFAVLQSVIHEAIDRTCDMLQEVEASKDERRAEKWERREWDMNCQLARINLIGVEIPGLFNPFRYGGHRIEPGLIMRVPMGQRVEYGLLNMGDNAPFCDTPFGSEAVDEALGIKH